MAERMVSAEYRQLISRFYESAAEALFDHDGAIAQFIGDGVAAFFIPALAGDQHAARGVDAAQALLRATGHADPDGPWLPVGAGVHTGPAWIGTVGAGSRTEFTALGDTVNTTSRLASAAHAGEILVSAETARAAGLDPGLEHRRLELKGKEGTTEVVTLTVASDR
jgi:adenylate cyclase